MSVNFLGVRNRKLFAEITHEWRPDCDHDRVETTALPVRDENFFGWLDLLAAVETARERFTMVELGAGWGRWMVAGAVAARQLGMAATLVGVEAEPDHFDWIADHLRDNGFDPADHWLIPAAVHTRDGEVSFVGGNPVGWFGQCATDEPDAFRNLAMGFPYAIETCRAIALSTILDRFERVDLIDADIQGTEADVFESARGPINEKVARVHIGTHDEAGEARLRLLFKELGWAPVWDFACLGRRVTPFGVIDFNDGAQSWVNPRLERKLD